MPILEYLICRGLSSFYRSQCPEFASICTRPEQPQTQQSQPMPHVSAFSSTSSRLFSPRAQWLARFAPAAMTMVASAGTAAAASILIPNFSFESPDIVFASPLVDNWTKLQNGVDPQTGTFDNTPEGDVDHIDNADGAQVAFVFGVPGAGLVQDLTSPDAKFEIGMAYTLTAGFVAGGGGMVEGTVIQLALYYRDASNGISIVAVNPVTFTLAAFPNRTHLSEYAITTPVVQGGDAWAGKAIGVGILAGDEHVGGYWDVDNVRLTSAVPEPTSVILLAAGAGLLLRRRRRSSVLA